MRYTTRTEYGLICLVYIAKQGALRPVTIKEMSHAEQYSQAYIEKILQSLRASGIVNSEQGNQGGYVLGRDADKITLKDIIDALEGQTFDIYCKPDKRGQIVCTHSYGCAVQPIWNKTKELLDKYYDSVSLEQLMNDAAELTHQK